MKLYDYYELKLEKLQVYIHDHNGKTATLQHKYIRDFTMQLRLYNCLEQMHPVAPSMKIGGILNRVDIVLTDYNIVYVLKILNSMQLEQQKLTNKIAEFRKGAVEKLVEQHGEEIAAKIAVELIAQKVEPEIKKESEPKKPAEDVGINPNKIIREFMVHFDDINLIIGRTIISTNGKYAEYKDFIEEMKKENPNEVPFLPDLRMGINGINLYGYMTYSGVAKAEAHIFRLYARDLQIYPHEGKFIKKVAKEFEYILANPHVETITERRVGDNYSAFKHNAQFFEHVETSQFFKEPTNQIDVDFDINLLVHKMKLALMVNDLDITLPHHSLVPPMYLLSEINSVLPAKPPPPEVPKLPMQPKPEMRSDKSSYSFILDSKIKSLALILPINVFFSSWHNAK